MYNSTNYAMQLKMIPPDLPIIGGYSSSLYCTLVNRVEQLENNVYVRNYTIECSYVSWMAMTYIIFAIFFPIVLVMLLVFCCCCGYCCCRKDEDWRKVD
jgi:hypothetical protein